MEQLNINYDKTFLTSRSRDYYRGASFHFSGKWSVGSHYKSDNYVVDFVVHGQVLLACAKSHLSSIENEPKDFVYDEKGNIIGIISKYWDFVLSGIIGKDGKTYVPSYNEGVITWIPLANDQIDSEVTVDLNLLVENSVENNHKWNDIVEMIPTQLQQLEDDTTHRLITDTERTDWNAKVDFEDLPTANLITRSEFDVLFTYQGGGGSEESIPIDANSDLIDENTFNEIFN